MCNVYGKICFVTNMLNMWLSLQAWVEKIVHGMETHWFSLKKNIPEATVSKEVFWQSSGMWKGPSILISLKNATANNTSFCQLLRKNSSYLFNEPIYNLNISLFRCLCSKLWNFIWLVLAPRVLNYGINICNSIYVSCLLVISF